MNRCDAIESSRRLLNGRVSTRRFATKCIAMQPNATNITVWNDIEATTLTGNFGGAGAEKGDDEELRALQPDETDASLRRRAIEESRGRWALPAASPPGEQQPLSPGPVRFYVAAGSGLLADLPCHKNASRSIEMRLFETKTPDVLNTQFSSAGPNLLPRASCARAASAS